MAINTLGSSLIAKSNPGGKLRETITANAEKPALPGKGDIGTIGRAQVEEPLNRPVSPGSDKVVAVQPTVEGSSVAQNDILPAGGIGLNESPTAPLRSGASNQSLFQGSAPSQPIGRVNPGGTTATPKVANTSPARAAVAYAPASMPVFDQPLGLGNSNQQVQGQVPARTSSPTQPTTGNKLGLSTFLTTGAAAGRNILRSLAAEAPSFINRAITGVSEAALRSKGGGASFAVPNPSYNKNLTPIQNIQQSPLGKAVGSIGSTVNNVLRSLFGGKK